MKFKFNLIKRLKEKIKKFFDNEKVTDFTDFMKFVLIHGFIGLFILLTSISIIGINFTIVSAIRNSYTLTILVFLIGSGGGYYILMDIIKFLNEMKGVNRK